MIVRIRVTEERLYDVVAESPKRAEELVRSAWLSGAASGSSSIGRIDVPNTQVRAISPRIPRSERRAAKAGK